jgi:hypothetical protein
VVGSIIYSPDPMTRIFLDVRKGGSLGDIPKNLTLINKISIYFGLSIHYQAYK